MKKFFAFVLALVLISGTTAVMPAEDAFSQESLDYPKIDFQSSVSYDFDYSKTIDISPWYSELLSVARNNGLISINDWLYLKEPITRSSLASLVVDVYKKVLDTYIGVSEEMELANPFIDTLYDNYVDEKKVLSSEYYDCLIAYNLKIMSGISETVFGVDSNVTREQLANTVVNLTRAMGFYADIQPSDASGVLESFNDKDKIGSWAASAVAYALLNNIMSGTSVTEFSPQRTVSMEEAFAVITRVFIKYGNPEYSTISITSHKDGDFISKDSDFKITWDETFPVGKSRDYIIRLYSSLDGYNFYSDYFKADEEDSPKEVTVPCEYIENRNIIYMVITSGNAHSQPVRVFAGDPGTRFIKYEIQPDTGIFEVGWLSVDGAAGYIIETQELHELMTNNGSSMLTSHDIVVPPGPIKTYRTYSALSVKIDYNVRRYYSINVYAVDNQNNRIGSGDSLLVHTGYVRGELTWEDLHYFEYEREAIEKHMKQITVNVWKINSQGNKVASTATMRVHEKLVDVYIKIFDEIFNGPEKFPIKDVGAYAWRGYSYSMHERGLAVDINSNENFFIRSSNVVGSFWKPYENVYSITPYGDVVKAFERNGFSWLIGDFMHFDYTTAPEY